MSAETDLYKEIREVCFRYLMRREYSQKELVQRLTDKGYIKSDSLEVIEALQQKGLQSDARFAESYARSRVHKGIGPLRIQSELQQRGAGDYPFDMAVEDIVGSWALLLEQVYTKKYGDTPCLERKEQAKRSRFLQQRGFTSDMIRRVLR